MRLTYGEIKADLPSMTTRQLFGLRDSCYAMIEQGLKVEAERDLIAHIDRELTERNDD